MKQKRISVKLTLNKATVTDLNREEMKVFGGQDYTELHATCGCTYPLIICRTLSQYPYCI